MCNPEIVQRLEIDLGFVPEHHHEGVHMCMIYSDDDERDRIVSKYLCSGVRGGEKVAYFGVERSKEEIRDRLLEEIHLLNEQDIYVADALRTACPDDVFRPDLRLESLRELYLASKSSGYRACRVTEEMHWVLQPVRGTERLLEYESQINALVQTHPVTALCQYDFRAFSSEILIGCLKVHPYLILNGQVVENPYYQAPDILLKEAPYNAG